jgi:hypothetical protein
MADNGRLTVDQKVKVVLFYVETKSVVATQRRFLAHFATRWAPCEQTIYRLCQQFETNGLGWRRSGSVPPVSIHLQSCDECKGSFARSCEAKRWSHWTCSSLGTIFQPMRINSVPDVKCFCKNKNVLCVQSIVWHFVCHPVDTGKCMIMAWCKNQQENLNIFINIGIFFRTSVSRNMANTWNEVIDEIMIKLRKCLLLFAGGAHYLLCFSRYNMSVVWKLFFLGGH